VKSNRWTIELVNGLKWQEMGQGTWGLGSKTFVGTREKQSRIFHQHISK
jgi:hypothetical protein